MRLFRIPAKFGLTLLGRVAQQAVAPRRSRLTPTAPGGTLWGMDENKLLPVWYAPWTWDRRVLVVAFVFWVGIYVVSFDVATDFSNAPGNESVRPVVQVLYTPLIFANRIVADPRP